MAVVGLSLPEATLVKEGNDMAFNWNFFGMITLFIVMLGYLYNTIL